jgi:hypothetical protein
MYSLKDYEYIALTDFTLTFEFYFYLLIPFIHYKTVCIIYFLKYISIFVTQSVCPVCLSLFIFICSICVHACLG